MNGSPIDVIRDIARIVVPVLIVVVWALLSVTGDPNADAFRELALIILAGYFGVDGIARASTRR
jgi:hypothetical protein